ncbi:MAG: restriction endonuclease [Acidimicrobiales bacterium]
MLLVLGTRVAGLGGVGFVLIVVGLVAAAGSRRVRARLALRHAQVGHADYMDATTFEHFAAEALRANGYRVDHVGRVGDFGADLVITGPIGRSVVQVKRNASNVGVNAVREAAAARAHYGTEGAIVLTNSYFTSQAGALARSNGVELWDRATLIRLASENLSRAPAAASTVLALEFAAGMAVIGRLLLATNANAAKRCRPGRRRRR